ncbi:MAG: TetR/AcrR family transcriptional regulator [Candidatus Sericytochromatia bacterium]
MEKEFSEKYPELISDKLHETKKKIIFSTLQLLSEGGYESFTAQNIINKAGISKGALYHHFKSIDDIPVEAIKQLRKSKLYVPIVKLDLFFSLEDYLDHYYNYFIENSKKTDVLAVSLYYSQKSLFNEEYRINKNCLTNDLLDYHKNNIKFFYSKSIPEDILNSVASLLVFTTEGIMAHSFMYKDTNKFRKTWDILIKTIKIELETFI